MKIPPLFFLFLASVAIRWSMIGSGLCLDVPNNDQWHVDILGMMSPAALGGVDWRFFFAPWQEHRLLVQKLYDCAVFGFLGRFDNRMECRVSAVIWSGLVCLFLWRLSRRLPDLKWWLLAAGAGALLLPFGMENTVNGFQAQTYWCVTATTWSAWLFADGKFWRGWLVSCLGIFTLASGFLAAPAFAVIVVIGSVNWPMNVWRRCAVLMLPVILALWLKGDAPAQAGHHARSVWEFAFTFGRYLGWPCALLPWAMPFIVAPALLLLWRRFQGSTEDTFAERLALMLFLIAAMYSALMGLARANMGADPLVSRYQDQYAPMLVAGALAIYELRNQARWREITAAWGVACFIGLGSLTEYTALEKFYSYSTANQSQTLATMALYLALNHNLPLNLPRQFYPAVDMDEKILMPELPALMTDAMVMRKIPALWNLDHSSVSIADGR